MEKIKQSNLRFYLLGCFTRSVDAFHKQMNFIHLVSSIFYTRNLNLDLVIEKYKGSDKFCIVIVGDGAGPHPYIHIDENIYYVDLYYFFGYFLLDNPSLFSGESFLDIVFGAKSRYRNNKLSKVFFGKSLFIFDSITYSDLQLLFRNRKVQVSGGSFSKRHLLSSVQYLLVNFLSNLNYSLADIYNSKNVLKDQGPVSIFNNWDAYKCEFMRRIIEIIVREEIDSMNVKLKSLGEAKAKETDA